MGPKGVSVDRNGHVIVVDNKACCVFIFQLNGKLVTKFGNRGNGDRQFAGTLNGNMCTSPPPRPHQRARACGMKTNAERGTIKFPSSFLTSEGFSE